MAPSAIEQSKTITPPEAQTRAEWFLRENALIRFSVGAPRRMVSPWRSVWVAPVELRYPNYGLVGEVGVIAVDEETGNVVAWTPREEMLSMAGELYVEQEEKIQAVRHTPPPEDPRHPLIDQREGAAGYEPAIRDTGVRVRNIVGYVQLGESIDDILHGITHITREQVEDALAYYADNKGEIDFFIEENNSDYLEYVVKARERRRASKKASTEQKAP